MRNIWTIAKKEYVGFFHSPIAYVVGFVVFLVMGIYFTYSLNYAISYDFIPEYTYVLDILIFPLIFLAIPILTMKTLSEENKSGTLEILLTWFFPLVLNFMVDPGIDQSKVVANYIGITLMASAMTAIGVYISSLFKNTIAALVASLGALLVLWLIAAPAQFLSGAVAEIFTNLSITQHYYNSFRTGMIDLLDVSYFISVTVLALFLGTRSIESKRWR